jgi:glutathione S-transferase
MPVPLLVIGSKRYSSWSLRPWIALKHLGIPFQERLIPLRQADTPARIREYSPAGKVPVLVDGDLTVHESIAILEYLNETHARERLLPRDAPTRARVRSVSAEMHAGFANVRRQLTINIGRKLALPALEEATRAEVQRILSLWEGLRAEHKGGGPFLFGAFGMADCMFLPVATRFHTYGVDLSGHPGARAYGEAMLALPAFQEWQGAAMAEPQIPLLDP